MLKGLKKYPFFGYFLSELPDAANRSIFAEALPVIWAVQGEICCCFFIVDTDLEVSFSWSSCL